MGWGAAQSDMTVNPSQMPTARAPRFADAGPRASALFAAARPEPVRLAANPRATAAWSDILTALRDECGIPTFESWLRPLALVGIDGWLSTTPDPA